MTVLIFAIDLQLDSGPEQRPFDIAATIEAQLVTLEVEGSLYIVHQVNPYDDSKYVRREPQNNAS